MGDYVSQAQRGLNNQISTIPATSPVPASDTDTQSSTASSSRDLIDISTADGEGSASSSTSASTATLPDPQQQQQRPDEAQSSLNAQTLFTRLQSSLPLPPDLLTGLRDTIPDSVRDAQARKELAQVAQARVQGAAARGEELLRGASVFLRDAVRVVPPEEADSSPSASTTLSAHEDTMSRGTAVPTPIAVSSTPATRRGALLRALRENPAILRVDPAGEERSAALFVSWVGRIGAEASRDESRRESELGADDGALQSTRSALGECHLLFTCRSVGRCVVDSSWGCLVPGELTEDEFWTRYFFRVHQIDQEEERRKAVLAGECCLHLLLSRLLTYDDSIAGPTDQDDDFSWEDDDEDAALKAEASPTPTAPVLNRDKLLSVIDASGTMSPQRSDDSYDIVSSGHASTAGDANAAHVNEGGTSDGDDDDDDDDDDEEESDWE